MSDGLPEGWEQWLAYFSAALPRPVQQFSAPDGSVSFRGGEPGEVIVHLTPHVITVSIFTVRRGGTAEPLVVARPVGYVRWQRLLPDSATTAVEALITAAREARLAAFRTCELCDRQRPPELMADERTCLSCVVRDAGVVH